MKCLVTFYDFFPFFDPAKGKFPPEANTKKRNWKSQKEANIRWLLIQQK